MNDLPYLVLSSDCTVLDASDEARKILGKLPDRRELMKSMSPADAARLSDACASGGSGQSFGLRLSRFRAACAVGKAGEVRLLLFGSTSELVSDETVGKIRYPENDPAPALPGNEEEITAEDVPAFIDALCVKMTKKGFPLSHGKIPKTHGKSGSVSLGALAFISSCLVEVLASSSRDGIDVRFSCFSDCFEITFGTKCGIGTGFIGTVSDVMCLASLIPGSAGLLSAAEHAALGAGIRLNCEATSDGRLGLGICVIPEDEPTHEFKFKDVVKLSLRLLDEADAIVSICR